MTREEAIKRIKERLDKQSWLVVDEDIDALYEAIPELAEDVDEKMRQIAIKAVHTTEAQACIKSLGVEPEDVIAWLEKKEETKMHNGEAFEIGDVVTDGRSTFKIVDIQGDNYITEDGDRVCFYIAHRYYTTTED